MSPDSTRPPGWAVAALGEITVKKVTQRPPRSPVSYIDIGSINKATKKVGETRVVYSETAPTRARQWVQAGDVLVSMTRPNLNAVALVGEGLDGVVASTGFDVLRPLEVLPRWVFYRVQSHDFVADVCQDLQGVVYPAIRPRDVRRHEIPIPPLPEQHRIVEAIETQFTRLEAAVETLKRVQANLKRYRASVLKAAVEGRLVPTEAEQARQDSREYEPASVLLERILEERRRRWEEAELAKMEAKGKEPKNDKWKAKYKEPVGPDTSELTELPEGWCYMVLEQFASPEAHAIKRGPFGSAIKKKYFVERGFKVYEQQHAIHNDFERGHYYVDQEKFDELRAFRVKARDVIISCSGTIGKAAIVPDDAEEGIINQALLKITPNEEAVQAEYFCALFAAKLGEVRVRGSAMKNITGVRDVKAIPFAVPPLAEQRRVLESLDDLVSVVDATSFQVESDIVRCQRLRQSILKWAFEGKLVDQDPEDEPASLLLGRVGAEAETKRS